MKYSEARLRRVLAGVRMVVGLVYVCYGYEKLFDIDFFRNGFMQRLSYWEDAVAPWYSWMWRMLADHASRWDVFFGGVELFIGLALLLGLATRPACLLGLLYTVHRSLLTWYPDGSSFTFWNFFEIHLEQILLLGLFSIMLAGHAGDVWGLGAIYHRVKVQWRPARPRTPAYAYFESEPEDVSEPLDHEAERLQRGA